MSLTTKTVTAEELLAMSDHKWLELYEGELKNVSPANARHGSVAVQIAALLQLFVKPRKLGAVMVEGGYILARNPDTVLGPDVSFVRQSRIPEEGLPEKFFDGPPDLAVEIISPTNPRKELLAKLQNYLDAGTPLAWLVEANAQTVDVFRPRLAVQRLKRTDQITGEDVIPAFSVTVSEFFQ
jgi:Uma2 family endonuclease